MSARHTAGPWSLSCSEMPHNGKLFCGIYGADGDAVVYATLRDREELLANARLIAAADDMFSTLIALEKWFDTDAEILGAMPEADRADNARQLAKIRAAIAKAKGGAA